MVSHLTLVDELCNEAEDIYEEGLTTSTPIYQAVREERFLVRLVHLSLERKLNGDLGKTIASLLEKHGWES